MTSQTPHHPGPAPFEPDALDLLIADCASEQVQILLPDAPLDLRDPPPATTTATTIPAPAAALVEDWPAYGG